MVDGAWLAAVGVLDLGTGALAFWLGRRFERRRPPAAGVEARPPN